MVRILLVANDRGSYANGWFDTVLGWLAILVMIAPAAIMFYQMLTGA